MGKAAPAGKRGIRPFTTLEGSWGSEQTAALEQSNAGSPKLGTKG